MIRRDFCKNIAAAAAGAVVTFPSMALAIPERQLERTVEIDVIYEWRKSDELLRWVKIDWSDLRSGDMFRLREPSGSLVDEGTVNEVSIAESEPSWGPTPTGHTWSVQCRPAKGDTT